MCLFQRNEGQLRSQTTKGTLEQLYDALRNHRDVYESNEYYCWLTAYYDDNVQNLDCGSPILRNTQTIDLLIDYIPKRLNILMEKPDHLRFILKGVEKEKMCTGQSLQNQKVYIDMVVTL